MFILLESGPVTGDLTTIVVYTSYKSLRNVVEPVHSFIFLPMSSVTIYSFFLICQFTIPVFCFSQKIQSVDD